MKKILIIFVVLIVMLSSCNSPKTNDISVDSSKTPLSHPSGEVLYVANTNSKTYHLATCYIAKRIKEENRFETRDIEFLRSRKYVSCKTCIKSVD